MSSDKRPWYERGLYFALAVNILLGILNAAGILALWNSGGNSFDDLDTISVSLTILQVFLVVLGFLGFWVVRSAAQEAARDEANRIAVKVAKSEAKKIARKVAKPAARRAAKDYLENNPGLPETDETEELRGALGADGNDDE